MKQDSSWRSSRRFNFSNSRINYEGQSWRVESRRKVSKRCEEICRVLLWEAIFLWKLLKINRTKVKSMIYFMIHYDDDDDDQWYTLISKKWNSNLEIRNSMYPNLNNLEKRDVKGNANTRTYVNPKWKIPKRRATANILNPIRRQHYHQTRINEYRRTRRARGPMHEGVQVKKIGRQWESELWDVREVRSRWRFPDLMHGTERMSRVAAGGALDISSSDWTADTGPLS